MKFTGYYPRTCFGGVTRNDTQVYFSSVNWLQSTRPCGRYLVSVYWATLETPLRNRSAQPVR